MRAVILAAGRGSRLAGRTGDRPKCLVELGGQPLLRWQIAALSAGGASEIGVVRGYRGEMLSPFGLVCFDNPDWASSNMVVSLTCAAAWLGEAPCVISYSDIFYPAEAIRRLIAAPGDLVVAYDPDWLTLWSARFADPLADAETFRLGDSGRIIEIGRRAARTEDIEGQYMGLLKITPRSWRDLSSIIAETPANELARLDMTSLLRRTIEAGCGPTAVAVPGPWGEVDNADDLALYETWLGEGRISLPREAL